MWMDGDTSSRAEKKLDPGQSGSRVLGCLWQTVQHSTRPRPVDKAALRSSCARLWVVPNIIFLPFIASPPGLSLFFSLSKNFFTTSEKKHILTFGGRSRSYFFDRPWDIFLPLHCIPRILSS